MSALGGFERAADETGARIPHMIAIASNDEKLKRICKVPILQPFLYEH
jgi:hypothetical protein